MITAVADQVPNRLAHLVYLDAFVPDDGQSLFDLLSPDARARRQEDARTMGDGWRVPSFPLASWGVTEDADVRWMSPRIGPQPLRTFTQAVQLRNFGTQGLTRTYISCTNAQAPHINAIAMRVRADRGWRYRELETGHDAMVTVPRQLADMLLECVQS